MALREATTNVLRHSQADSCRVRLENLEDQVRLTVQDNGKGSAGRDGAAQDGLGLTGMRERVSALDGDFNVEGRGGTTVTITVPVTRTADSMAWSSQRIRSDQPFSTLQPRAVRGRRMIRVVIAEDQGLVLGALAALLDLEDDIEVVATAENGNEALEKVREVEPDVVLTDIEMPGMTGLELLQALKEKSFSGRVIIVTTFGRSGYLRRALEGGAAGYLLKDTPAEELAEAVRRVHQGLRAVAPELAAQAWGEPDPLTDRERQVLQLAGEGLSNSKIADELHLSEGTVRNYLSEAIGKLGAANRTEAARLARKQGWL